MDTEFHAVAGREVRLTVPVMRPDEIVSAALAGLRLGEVVCIPGLADPALLAAVGQAQQALLLTAVGAATLAGRYQPA